MTETTGMRLYRLRRKQRPDLSARRASVNIGLATNSLARYERDAVLPDVDSLLKLADYYNVSCDFILLRTDDPKR